MSTSGSRLEEKFAIVVRIHRPQDETSGCIKSMSPTEVVITCDDGMDYMMSAEDLLSGQWKKEKVQKPPVPVDDPLKYHGMLQVMQVKAKWFQRIADEFGKGSHQDCFDMFSKPKGSFVNKDLASGKCILVPFTDKLYLDIDGKGQPPGSIALCDEKIEGRLTCVNVRLFGGLCVTCSCFSNMCSAQLHD